jgi:uncharacterized DUF497 family protein
MQFSWDEKKRRAIQRRRGFDILHAAGIFSGPVLTERDTRHDYGEVRYISLGKVGDEYFVVVHTPREEAEHLITAWRAGREARRRYKARFS